MVDFIRNYNKSSSLTNDTVYAGAIGTAGAIAGNYGIQKIMIKYPEYWTDYFEKKATELVTEGDNQSKINACKKQIDLIKKGKTNWNLITKRGLKTGGILAGIYFTYRCIKSLLIRNE